MKVFFLVYVEVSALDIFLCLFGGLALGLGARDSISRFVGPSVGPSVRRSVHRSLIARSTRLMAIGLVFLIKHIDLA